MVFSATAAFAHHARAPLATRGVVDLLKNYAGSLFSGSLFSLGPERVSRGVAYAGLFDGGFATEAVDEIRRATATSAPFATRRFHAQIEAMLGRRVAPLPKGRPRKTRGA